MVICGCEGDVAVGKSCRFSKPEDKLAGLTITLVVCGRLEPMRASEPDDESLPEIEPLTGGTLR